MMCVLFEYRENVAIIYSNEKLKQNEELHVYLKKYIIDR